MEFTDLLMYNKSINDKDGFTVNASDSEQVDLILLSEIAQSNIPLGAGNLFEILSLGNKLNISEATIGRCLRRYENRGYLKSESYSGRPRGRVITETGLEYIQQLTAKKKQALSVVNVMELLHDERETQLRNVLATRMILEPQIAALAAKNATEDDLEEIRTVLENMDQLTIEGANMASTDAPFHISVAKASGNPVLHSIMQMIRADQDFSPVMETVVKIDNWLVPSDHWAIYKAIEKHDDKLAGEIMQAHIQNLIAKLDAFEEKNK